MTLHDPGAAVPQEGADNQVEASRSRSASWRALRSDWVFLLTVGYLMLLVALALLAPLIAPQPPGTQDLSSRLLPPFWMEEGSTRHLLGTDNLGRDVLSRLLYGARISLLVGCLVTLVAGSVGVLLGLVAGYRRGWPERVIMGWIDLQVSFPVILLIILILSVVGRGLWTLVICISLTHWLLYARTTRSAVLTVASSSYVEAAEVAGATGSRVLTRHVLPNAWSTIITLALLEFASVILVEAALSFLGLGIQPPLNSWGLDISVGKEYIFNAWWLVTFPGLAIAMTVLALNLASSSIRSALDPTTRATRLLTRAEFH